MKILTVETSLAWNSWVWTKALEGSPWEKPQLKTEGVTILETIACLDRILRCQLRLWATLCCVIVLIFRKADDPWEWTRGLLQPAKYLRKKTGLPKQEGVQSPGSHWPSDSNCNTSSSRMASPHCPVDLDFSLWCAQVPGHHFSDALTSSVRSPCDGHAAEWQVLGSAQELSATILFCPGLGPLRPTRMRKTFAFLCSPLGSMDVLPPVWSGSW